MRTTSAVIILMFIFMLSADAQLNINGRISDSVGHGLSTVTVYYTDLKSSVILGFSRSDTGGNYVLKIRPIGDSLMLHFNLIGYIGKTIKVAAIARQINCTLKQTEEKLPDIIVKNAPIKQYGDSINYSVNAFINQKDRSIGDVLKKMPGVNVGDNGQVYYQGKAIQKLSINGLNLMEGRYSTITNNLPAGVVTTVQVIEHDQPIRILDSLVPSNNVSINLKLKKLTTTGNGEIGVGLSPFLRDINISHMTFLKDFQTINTFATNNTGKDQTVIFKDFQPNGIFSNRDVRLVPITSLGTIPTPLPDKRYWLDNDINLFSSNSIWKTPKNWEIKIGIGYYSDKQKQEGSTLTQILTSEQSVNIKEDKKYEIHIKEASGYFVIEKNTKQFFFRNNFSIFKGTQNDSSIINDRNVLQGGFKKNFSIANKSSMILPIGKQLFSVSSQLNYATLPENLNIYPGTFKDIFNDSGVFNIVQNIRSKSLISDNSIELTKEFWNINLSPKIGYTINHASINSIANTNSSESNQAGSLVFTNDVNYRQNDVYASLRTGYKYKSLELSLTTPFHWTSLKLKTNENYLFNRLMFLPNFYGTYHFSPDLFFSISASKNMETPDIKNFFGNYIITNYRQTQKNDIDLSSLQRNSAYSAGFQYRNTPKFLFLNGNISINYGKRNYMDSTQIAMDGAAILNTIMRSNKFRSTSVSFDGSKFLLTTKTVLKLTGTMDNNQEEQFVNEKFSKFKTLSFLFKTFITTSFSKYIIMDYNATLHHAKSSSEKANSFTFDQYTHHFALSILPSDEQLLNISVDSYSNSGTLRHISSMLNTYFRLSFIKSKTDIYLYCNNILNTKYYSSFFTSSNVVVQSNYVLRPRQVGISYKFYFK